MLGEFFEQGSRKNPLVLTANSRLSRSLHEAYQQDQVDQGRSVFETPRILPYSSWLANCFHQSNSGGKILLSSFQELSLWEKIIRRSTLTPDLWQPTKTAELVQQAWEFLNLWEVPLADLKNFNGQLEVICLTNWIDIFQVTLQKNNFITIAELPCYLKTQDEKNNLLLDDNIVLMGFDDFPPAHQNLLTQLRKRISIETKTLSNSNSTVSQIILADPKVELLTMAKWAKALYLQNPKTTIGCVIADLGSELARVKQVFHRVFADEKTETGFLPFNISAGTSLNQQSMIQVALKILNWGQGALDIHLLADLLQSPYLCFNEADANMGAQMDCKLRELNYISVLPEDLFQVMEPLQNIYRDSTWLSRIRQFILLRNNLPQTLLPSKWMAQFIELLKSMQWPGQKTQSSEAFQLLERFKKCCLEFCEQDMIVAEISFHQALQLFQTLCKQSIFQAKSHHEPIQIMGVLEASSIQFDAVWIIGLHDGAWPSPTTLNPFIPIIIQQKYQMPHATALRELQFCEQITSRLISSGKQVIFSSPTKIGDLDRKPSRLIQDINFIELSDLNLNQDENKAELIFKSQQLENLNDNTAPTITDFSSIQGGSAILKHQAVCPFKAMASIRLKAKSFAVPALGISPMQKGILVHQILCDIWGELKDLATLKNYSDEKLRELIKINVIKALEKEKISGYFVDLEKIRLTKLILNFLTFEKTRPDFKVIERESTLQITLNQLPLTLRQDRIDELADGSLLLIDYKTGKTNIQHWLQTRLQDPQLPLYLAFQEAQFNKTSGIAFAEIKSNKIVYKGVISENHLYSENNFSGLKAINTLENALNITAWKDLIDSFKQSLTALAQEFCDGHAVVNPIEITACETCDLQSLCRVKTNE